MCVAELKHVFAPKDMHAHFKYIISKPKVLPVTTVLIF